MYQEILQMADLSQNEARIYEALLGMGESSVPQVAVKTGIHRRNTYDTMERLVEKGLVFPVFSSGDNHYNAVDPGKLVEILSEKQQKIESIMPSLEAMYLKKQCAEEAYIYRGLEGQKQIWRDVLRVGQTSYMVGANAAWFDPRIEASTNAFFRDANRKKIKFVQLFDFETPGQVKNFPKHFPGQLEYRILPKEYSTNSIIHIFGDYVVTYTGVGILNLGEGPTFFILRSQQLADSYRIWFQALWKVAK